MVVVEPAVVAELVVSWAVFVVVDDSMLDVATDDVLTEVAALVVLLVDALDELTLAFGRRWTMTST